MLTFHIPLAEQTTGQLRFKNVVGSSDRLLHRPVQEGSDSGQASSKLDTLTMSEIAHGERVSKYNFAYFELITNITSITVVHINYNCIDGESY